MARNEIHSEVMLNIFNPHETFTPKHVRGELIELSSKSARVKTYQLTRQECEMLMEERMLSKIVVTAPVLRKPLTLKADIFWAKYIVMDMTEPPYCDLGFNLRAPKEGDEPAFRQLVEFWEKQNPPD
jgi:hypothetical protein